MSESSGQEQMLRALGVAGYYIALRVSFAFPASETNKWPKDWVKHYFEKGLMPVDPLIHWAYSHTGSTRWSSLQIPDPEGVLDQAARFGLSFGVVVSVRDEAPLARSFGLFARNDREFFNDELQFLQRHLQELHDANAPPKLTKAELDALRMIQQGFRLKRIGHELGVTEGAIKQRLKSAKLKLGAKTAAQAAAIAVKLGLM
jgi:LuxR family transcriptional regulator, quorum-sensing system regulator SdiA